jgi:hypothetical protein
MGAVRSIERYRFGPFELQPDSPCVRSWAASRLIDHASQNTHC